MTTPAGGFHDAAPVAWQDIGGQRVAVATAYALKTDAPRPMTETSHSVVSHHSSVSAYGFSLGAYDRTQPLVIDPAMFVYAGFIGGSGYDQGNAIAVDSAGNAYVTGYTESTETTFPDGDGIGALTGFDTTYNGDDYDAFVVKISAPEVATPTPTSTPTAHLWRLERRWDGHRRRGARRNHLVSA